VFWLLLLEFAVALAVVEVVLEVVVFVADIVEEDYLNL